MNTFKIELPRKSDLEGFVIRDKDNRLMGILTIRDDYLRIVGNIIIEKSNTSTSTSIEKVF